jgi:hypothetical protein
MWDERCHLSGGTFFAFVNGKRTGMVQRFVLIHERSIKELINSLQPKPFQALQNNCFEGAYRRGKGPFGDGEKLLFN